MIGEKALLCFLLLLLCISLVHAQVSFVKDLSNPVIQKTLVDECGDVSAAEPASLYDNGSVRLWYRSCINGGAWILYASSVDGRIFSKGGLTSLPGGLQFPYVLKDDVVYHLFASSSSDGFRLVHYYGYDGVGWSNYCIGPMTGLVQGLEHFNPAVYLENGTWHLLLEHGDEYTSYYTSIDGCHWEHQSDRWLGVSTGNSWLGKSNSTWVSFYGLLRNGAWEVGIATGENISGMNITDDNILCGVTQPYETKDLSDPDIVIIPESNGTVPGGAYLYYSADQMTIGVAYANRTMEGLLDDALNTSLNRTCGPFFTPRVIPIISTGWNSPIITRSGGGGGGGIYLKKNNSLTPEELREKDKREAKKEYLDSLKENKTDNTSMEGVIVTVINPWEDHVSPNVFANMTRQETPWSMISSKSSKIEVHFIVGEPYPQGSIIAFVRWLIQW